MAPGITWANYGSDGGDLITAAAVGGVPHPSGYPVYLLLARLFQFLPAGSLAFRTNLLSAVATTLAAILVFALVSRWLTMDERPNWIAGLASAYAFGLAPLVWSQAVITEVYGLHILFVVLILSLSAGQLPLFFTPRRLDLCLGLAFGLSLSNHVTTLLLLPLLFSNLPEYPGRSSSMLRRAAWMGVGLLTYVILPLRAMQNPPVSWGNPVTPRGFMELVTGEIYQNRLLSLDTIQVWERMRTAAGLLLDQAGLPGLIVAVIGLVFFFKSSRLYRNTVWMALVFLIFALVYGTTDSFVYLMPVCLGVAIWIGMGLHVVQTMLVPRWKTIASYFGLAFILFLFSVAGSHRQAVDASQDMRAENFGRDVLTQAPANAIVFTRGDRALFALWYFHFAQKERSDLVVVAADLLHFDWYQQNLHAAYPAVQLPGPFPFTETLAAQNPDRPICFVEFTEKALIQCRPADAHP